MTFSGPGSRQNFLGGPFKPGLNEVRDTYRPKYLDYEKVKLEDELIGHTADVVILKFLNPFPILLSADNSG